MKVMVVGDAHGDLEFVRLIMQRTGIEDAESTDLDAVDKVVFLGDFGAWEHTEDGVEYFDRVSILAEMWKVDAYFLGGNHDNEALVLEKYGDNLTEEGFIKVRDRLFLLPRGLRWTWGSTRFISLGGAYSVDKEYRLAREQKETWALRGRGMRHLGLSNEYMDSRPDQFSAAGTLWFPGEEMTDEDMDTFLKDTSPVDVILAHDKPRASNPEWNRKDIPECYPNQDRLQKAVRVLQPSFFYHGHLHFEYEDDIMCGDDYRSTHVVGLECNRKHSTSMKWRLEQTYRIINA